MIRYLQSLRVQNQGKIQLSAKTLALQWLLFTYILLQLRKQSEENKNGAYLLLIFLKAFSHEKTLKCMKK